MFRATRIQAIASILLLMGVISSGSTVADDVYTAQTTVDAAREISAESAHEISIDRLRTRLKPLAVSELAVEAHAWFNLVQAKSFEIRDAELGVRDARRDEEEARRQAASAPVGEADSETPEISETERQAAAAAADQLRQERTARVETAVGLRDERTKLIDRFKVVLTEWSAKGGDRSEYDKYINSVAGFEIDVTDTASAWTAVRAWLVAPEGGLRWARNIGFFMLTLFIFWFIAALVGAALRRVLSRATRLSELLRSFLVTIIKRAILLVGLVFALQALEINISPLVAAIGGAAFVIAFALQGTLSNFASGLLLLLYRPYDVGDVINAAGITGKVEAMNLVSTIVATADNQVLMVPNNAIWGGVITNVTGRTTRRVDMTFGIGYGDDIGRAIAVLNDVVKAHPKVLESPAPTIQVHELADSSVNLVVRPWTATADYWDVYWDLIRQVKERFDAEGVSIPFPQRDVHVYQHAAPGK